MIRVLFVCLGNICRSPMAEAVFRSKVKEAGLEDRIAADSAGTGSWHVGQPPHEGTRRILQRNGIDYAGIRARQTTAADFESFDYIIAMDSSNIDNLRVLPGSGQEHRAVLKKLLDFVPPSGRSDVPDSYYTGNFEEVFELVSAGCDNLLAFIREQESI